MPGITVKIHQNEGQKNASVLFVQQKWVGEFGSPYRHLRARQLHARSARFERTASGYDLLVEFGFMPVSLRAGSWVPVMNDFIGEEIYYTTLRHSLGSRSAKLERMIDEGSGLIYLESIDGWPIRGQITGRPFGLQFSSWIARVKPDDVSPAESDMMHRSFILSPCTCGRSWLHIANPCEVCDPFANTILVGFEGPDWEEA